MEQKTRKQTRLKEYDYSSAGVYFITMCVKNKKPLLWDNVGLCIKANRLQYMAKTIY